jgi:hypothetical protein
MKNMGAKLDYQNIANINYFLLFKIIQKFLVLIAHKKKQIPEKLFLKNQNHHI